MAKARPLAALNVTRPSVTNAEEWISGQHPAQATEKETTRTPATKVPETTAPPPEATKRLNLPIPATLHTLIKVHCAEKGIPMVDDIIPILEAHYRPKK